MFNIFFANGNLVICLEKFSLCIRGCEAMETYRILQLSFKMSLCRFTELLEIFFFCDVWRFRFVRDPAWEEDAILSVNTMWLSVNKENNRAGRFGVFYWSPRGSVDWPWYKSVDHHSVPALRLCSTLIINTGVPTTPSQPPTPGPMVPKSLFQVFRRLQIYHIKGQINKTCIYTLWTLKLELFNFDSLLPLYRHQIFMMFPLFYNIWR